MSMTEAEREALLSLLTEKIREIAKGATSREVPEVQRLDKLRRQIETDATLDRG